MSDLQSKPSLADRGQALGLRLITRAGGLESMKNPGVRRAVERVLYNGARQGFKAQTAAGRAFAKQTGTGAPARNAPTKPRRELDLTPTEDQAMIQQVARELADELLRPAASTADAERTTPAELRAQAGELGLTLVGVPAELGGVAEERSAVTAALVLEELARGDMGLAVSLMATGAVATALAAYGDASQQATYLPAFADEKNPPVAALALMEPQPLFDPFALRTTARAEGDELVIDGVKAMVPNADSAELFVVSATLDGESRLVIVEPGTDGIRLEQDPGMGVRAARTGRLTFAGVRVPRTNLLGTADDHRDAVRRARLAWAAAAVGTAQAVLDQVSEYVKERKAFGEPIGHRQAVAFTVADIAIELDGLRLVVWRAAALLDAGQDASAQIAHARHLAATYGAQIGSHAVQLLGGHGFVKEFDNERWYRDLRATGVLEGALLL
ncbi:acyl-CoA dehydrogenase family protein [Luteipulveratus sp. YIM 133132]|uniref:acyl-CoA dehydrogenase family protein n=1 Tax=Luteipulveratus flavus TaxID=3031728 RepID=UPI0023B1A8D0|nr:acyl-CoA dehydrogenase family protein [Luteipulveratus sp. YIM 133132]MDE9367593.1 acyl-CoA dehydrogenase family protein [Luteipulveratus sp. YIM 133132]